jgi:hypothetical protein
MCGQMLTLLHDGPGGVVLQADQVLHVLGHHSYAGVEVGSLEVTHGLRAPLLHRILLILSPEKRDRDLRGS